jgi:transmembrane sensor
VNKKKASRFGKKHYKDEYLPNGQYLLDKYLASFPKEGLEWDENLHGEKHLEKDKIYLNIKRKIRFEEKNIILRAFYSSALVKAAALVIAMFVLGAGIYLLVRTPVQVPAVIAWNERTTLPGEKAIITLNDNSKIILNAASKLKYPLRFTGNSREIYLEGEAFFEVSHDSSKPFIVHSSNITTTVLGTKFNINAYKPENEISVSLLEGKVKVSNQKMTGAEDIMLLKPAQQLIYNKSNEISEVVNFDVQKETGWKDNILKFKNEPLDKVFVVLERAFGVKFELDMKGQAKPKISATFKNDSIQTILTVLKNLTDLQYKIERENNVIKKVKFYKK